MSDYATLLEEQNEHLRQKLVEADKPFAWVTVDEPYDLYGESRTVLEMRVKGLLFGYISKRKVPSTTNYNFTAICQREEKAHQCENIENARGWVEDWFMSMFITERKDNGQKLH
jgi:hypothetical protein